MKSSQFAPLAIACALSIASATATFAVDPITSTWSGQDANSDWFDAGNWSAGVPSQPGDVAIIRSNSIASRRPVLSGPVSVGQLQFLMLSGQATVGGTGLVTFDQPGDAPARLVVGTPTPTEATLSTPWGVAAGETLSIEVPTSRTLFLLGTMTSAEGDIELSGGGVADFRLGNAAWNGDLAVRGGILRVRQGAVFGSTAGLTSIHASGTLEIATSNAINEPMQLNGGSLEVSTSNNGISGPIAVDADSRIHARSNFQLQSNLTGPGGLTLSGLASSGTLFVSGDNSYQGLTVVSGGRVTVRSANGLGATTAGTQIKTGGHLQLEAPTAEPLLLQGGTVYLTSAATATGLVTMESGTLSLTADGNYQQPITLAGKGSPITIAGRSQLTGGVVGKGDLTADGMVQVHTNPLSHQGGLNVTGEWILDGPNTYTGNTHVTGILEANHPQALGLSDSPVTVDGGVLRLGTAFTRDIYLAGGGLNVPDAGTVIDGQVRMNASSRSPLTYGSIGGKGTFNGEIIFEPSTYSRATVNGGQFNGTITGSVDLLTFGSISPEATRLNTNNSYRGMTLVQNGRVEANAARALGSADDGTMVSYAQLDLNVDVDEPIIVDHSGKVLVNVQQSRLPRMFRTDMFNPPRTQELVLNHAGTYSEHVEAAEGTLRVNHNTTITGATIREGGGVVVADGAALTLVDEGLELQSGSLSGRIEGVGLLRKTSGFEARVSNLQGFDGRIDIESGRLRVVDGAGLGTGNGATHLIGQNSVLFFNLRDGGTFDDDIYLNNSQGDLRVPALYVARESTGNSSVRLAGTLDLGSQGSSLGGPDSLSTSDGINLYIAGRVTGGSVSTYGRRAMFFVETPNADYSGDTNLVQGTMVLTGEGRLNSTSAIHLHEVEASHKGTLELANRITRRDDRIDDEFPCIFMAANSPVSAP
ncbi:hypothetical protein [Aeoliella sp. SH292]|uniref:hypothetical protein n=1 Tax=Aeoliella sp. SH292 TaxID=3454464 RepID=UPI003F980DB7